MTRIDPQGPAWLTDLVMWPPLWVKGIVFVLAGIVVGAAAWRVYRRDLYISLDEQRSMLLIVGTAQAVAVATAVSMRQVQTSYVGHVAIGLLAGFAGVEAIRWGVRAWYPRQIDWQSLAAGWTALLFSLYVIWKAALRFDLAYLGGMGVAIASVGSLMLAWAVAQDAADGRTLGELLRES